MPDGGTLRIVTDTSLSFCRRCSRAFGCWAVMLVQGVLWCVARLPVVAYPYLARLIGRILLYTGARRRHIAEVNLRLCFPELNPEQLRSLRNAHFTALGYSVIEVGLAWWGNRSRLKSLGRARGLEHLQQVHDSGRGAILLGAHYSTLDIGGTILGIHSPITIRPVYRPHENPWLDEIVIRRRSVFLGAPIARDNIREMIRTLHRGGVVWFASDQNYGLKHSVFSPFFGVPAATNTAITRIAALTNAAVLPYVSRRLPDGTYDEVIHPPLENFPSGDPQADMDRVNKLIEAEVRLAPEQYWWIHRRFKDRPPGLKDVYADSDRTA